MIDSNIKEQWVLFCRNLYRNLLIIEKKFDYNKLLEESYSQNKPFTHREKLIKKKKLISEYKKKIEYSARNKKFELEDGDFDYILKNGYFKFFRIFGDIDN